MNWPPPRTPRSRSCASRSRQRRRPTDTVDDHDYSEAETRDLFIDLLLAEAGWPLADERDREFEVTGMPNNDGNGFVDYVLWGDDGKPLGARRGQAHHARRRSRASSRPSSTPTAWRQQFGQRPVIFYTNGYEHWIWDDAAGYPPRQVQGFYTKRRAGAADPAPHDPPAARPTRRSTRRSSSGTTSTAPSARSARPSSRQAAQGAAGHGDRRRARPAP